MSDLKFLSDGRKVSVIGKINKTEFIVQEVFVTASGDEIPSGENFTAKSLHDAPVQSYKEKEAARQPNEQNNNQRIKFQIVRATSHTTNAFSLIPEAEADFSFTTYFQKLHVADAAGLL